MGVSTEVSGTISVRMRKNGVPSFLSFPFEFRAGGLGSVVQ